MLDTIWREAQRRLQAELPTKDYEAWIEPLKAARWAPGELTLETPSGFFRSSSAVLGGCTTTARIAVHRSVAARFPFS